MDDPTRFALADTAVAEELRRWRCAYPDTTLTQIEIALDALPRPARAGLLAGVATATPDRSAHCPDCGGRLVRRGTRTHTLRTTGDEPVPLRRPYLVCSACGAKFPPSKSGWGYGAARA